MKFVLQSPSLQHLAGIKTVAALWNQPDILKLIAELTATGMEIEEDDVEWKAVTEKVESHALALELTQPCKQQLLKLIKPLGREILVWRNHQYTSYTDNHDSPLLRDLLPRIFCWTMHGVIDYAKTAQLMTKDDSLPIERRYEMACMHCLEDEARQLFPLVPEVARLEYINTSIDIDFGSEHLDFVVYFSCILSDDLDRLNRAFQQVLSRGFRSIHLHLCNSSLFSINPAAIHYFFNKLKQGEKEFLLVNLATNVFAFCRDSPRCNLLYYLSLMNEGQQRHMFRKCIGDVLICLLGWPIQSLFREAAMCGWRYMLYHDYEKVLCAIARKISDGYQDYEYSQLFGECWRLTPADVKRRLLDDVAFLERLYDTKKDEFMKLILNEATPHQISALIDRGRENIQEFLVKFRTVLEENSIPDDVLKKWKETVALNSSNDRGDKETRLRREISQLIDIKMEERVKRRRL